MAQEMEKPRITEIKVRMDCNGCVQKIKKALQGITGISDLYIDFPQQKITIIGWADPVAMVKAIKKTRKSAIICSHMNQSEQPTEPVNEGGTPEGGAPPPERKDPPAEQAQTEAGPPVEQPHDSPPPEPKPSTESANATGQPTQPSKPKDAEEIHVVYRYPPEYGYRYAYGQNFQQSNGPGFRDEPFQPYARGPGYSHPGYESESFQPHIGGPGYSHPGYGGEPFQPYTRGPVYSHQAFRGEPFQAYTRSMGHRYEPSQPHTRGPGLVGETSQHSIRGPGYRDEPSQAHNTRPGFVGEPSQPIYVTHSYNTYKPSPYVTEYAYPRSPPRYSRYSIPDHYRQDYHDGNVSNGNGNGNITSLFSEENPNACRIA